MNRNKAHFSREALIAAIEENLREFWANWGRAPRAELLNSPEMTRLYTGVPLTFCNGVNCGPLPPDKLDAVIDETIAYYRERTASWEWVIGPQSNPPDLDKALEKHGLTVLGESTGMAIDLAGINRAVPPIEDFRVDRVESAEALVTWAKTMIEGFAAPALSPTFVELECSLGCDHPAYRRYIGILNGQPVATSALLLGGNVAGIYCVSTLPAARRLGIGAAITQYGLLDAQVMGYRVAVLQASQMGRSVYRRLGFEEYSLLRVYGWKG